MPQKRFFWDSKLSDYIEDLIGKLSNWYFHRKYDTYDNWSVQPTKSSATLEEAYEEPKVEIVEQPKATKKKRVSRKKK